MKVTSITFGLAVCIASASASSSGYSYYPNIQHENASDNERALAYSLNLLDKITDYVTSKATDHTARFQPSEIPLSALGLDSPGSPKKVSDLFDTVHIKLSDSYTFTIGDIPSTKSGGKDMMQIPFDHVFTLSPSSIHYISNILATLSRLDTAHLSSIAPIFGFGSKSVGSPENSQAIAKLLNAIANMDPSSRGYIARASIGNSYPETDDPLSKHVQFFSLANLGFIERQRVEGVTEFFNSLGAIHGKDISKYLYSIGWEIKDSHKEQSLNAAAARIPNPSMMFFIQDATLVQMSHAASQYSSGKDSAQVEGTKQAVENSLSHVRDFLDFIPGYSTIASLMDLTNNPIVNMIVQIISLSYKHPDSSYLQLALMYYQSIGMPGLQGIMDYPSQYAGSIASSVVGGYVSDAIGGVLTNLLFPSKTATSISAASPSTTATVPTSSSTTRSSPSISSSSSSSSSGGNYWWPFGYPASTTSTTSSSSLPLSASSSSSSSSSNGDYWWPFGYPASTTTLTTTTQPPSVAAAPLSTSTTSRIPTVSKTSPSSSSSSKTSNGSWWPVATSQNTNVDVLSQPKLSPMTPALATASKPALEPASAQATSAVGNTLQATINLDKWSSTHVVYTLSQNSLPTLVLTLIPPHS